MTLEQWASNNWLRAHKTSKQEISSLLAIVTRDMKDAEGSISADWRFGIAYNAALKLCTILLFAEGYEPAKGQSHHYRTLASLPLILGREKKGDAEYLDACRAKRNIVEYDSAGGATDANAEELLAFTKEFAAEVTSWLQENHPELL